MQLRTCLLLVLLWGAKCAEGYGDLPGHGSSDMQIILPRFSFPSSRFVTIQGGLVTSIPVGGRKEVTNYFLHGGGFAEIPVDMRSGSLHSVEHAEGPMKLDCNNHDAVPCVFWVVLFKCPGCTSIRTAPAPARLAEKGFAAGSCGPKLRIRQGSHKLSTVVFKRYLAAGATVTVDIGKAEFVGVFSDSAPTACLTTSLDQCGARPNCRVAGDQCVETSVCPGRRFTGPVGPVVLQGQRNSGPQRQQQQQCICPDRTPPKTVEEEDDD